MPDVTLMPAAVRAALIHAQGLQRDALPHPATRADVRQIIRQMQVLQIDTIHVVARSPYLVLWSRLGDYQAKWLEELLAEGSLFEFWSHAACFLPIEDYPYYRRLMLEGRKGWTQANGWLAANLTAAEAILNHIRSSGAVRSSDFKRSDGQSGTWWNWKTEKIVLEAYFNTGELMVASRHNFQRIYDLRERVLARALPDYDENALPTFEQVLDHFTLNAIKALGATRAAWVADYFRMGNAETLKTLKALTARGELRVAAVEGWNDPVYYHPDHQPLLDAAQAGTLLASKTTLLSPFDPIIWDRKRATELFKFDYRIECYTPAPKRIYGYFTLPILYNNALIGRLDPKAHRKDKLFEVKALYLEPDVEVTDDLVREVRGAIQACAAWHQTPQVVVRRSDPPEMAALLSD